MRLDARQNHGGHMDEEPTVGNRRTGYVLAGAIGGAITAAAMIAIGGLTFGVVRGKMGQRMQQMMGTAGSADNP
jgi:hypothetical protein